MTANPNPNAAAAVAQALRDGITDVRGRAVLNEDVTKDAAIWPALTALGYPPAYRIPEYTHRSQRPDCACYLEPAMANPRYAALIVEAKTYGTNFDRRPPGGPRAKSPDRQLQGYLKTHRASGPGTFGVLTDGARWRIYQRAGTEAQPDARFVAEYDFNAAAAPPAMPGLSPPAAAQLAEFASLLSWASLNFGTRRRPRPAAGSSPADRLFAALSEDPQPAAALGLLLDGREVQVQSDLTRDVALAGTRREAHDTDWESYAYAPAIPMAADGMLPPRDGTGTLAVVRHRHDPDLPLNRAEAALCARTFAAASPAGAAVALVYAVAEDGAVEARLAVAAAGQVNMTAAFDPALPSPSARVAIGQLLQRIGPTVAAITPAQLLEPLEAAPLRQQFYQEVARWTGRQQRGRNLEQRQAVLRHLVRVLFAWILKEENIIPPELFEAAFVAANLASADDYHQAVLRFLFHHRLNTPAEQRDDHPAAALNDAMAHTPFLNGSLFAEHRDDDGIDIPAGSYWSAVAAEPGLFTILSRYHWTMDEHRPGETEQTLDPELLSNLFERLIAPTETGDAAQARQPHGTYYTPADVADEMVKDALTAAVKTHAPRHVSEARLLELFGDDDAPAPELTAAECRQLARRIRELRIFDPAAGSGEFLFRALLALQRALGKLEPDGDHPPAAIIRRQLSGQDIHPLAVQITRLRLFVAITAARRSRPGPEPLPNLEARVVCADTLETRASPDWRPGAAGDLTDADAELVAALTAVAENRARWYDAHTEPDKQARLAEDQLRRDRLSQLLQARGELAGPELAGFARSPMFDLRPNPARTDARLLFYENPWPGFDVVIGNPPYESLAKSFDPAGRRRLASHKGYRTANSGDLYTLFCETALALAKPNGGVVTLIVPLSIAFGTQQAALRQLFEERCREINLRHYNNNPSMLFHTTPTTKDPRNRQRVTVLTATSGQARTPIIRSTGLQRWPAAQRKSCLSQRHTATLPRFGARVNADTANQWPRVPTEEVAAMVRAILQQKRTIQTYESAGGAGIALPAAAEYFISAIPSASISPRTETTMSVASDNDLRLLMAAYNGHVAYAWWWIYGDGFHVKPTDFAALTVPDAWVDDPVPAIELGERLLEAMEECQVEITIHRKTWRNVNFHLRPDLVAELDRRHLAALGLPEEPLLSHLRTMRSSSSWNYGAQ